MRFNFQSISDPNLRRLCEIIIKEQESYDTYVEDLQSTAYWLMYEVDPNILHKAYRYLAVRYHPDGGGSIEQFSTLREVYEILTGKNGRENTNLDNYGISMMIAEFASTICEM